MTGNRVKTEQWVVTGETPPISPPAAKGLLLLREPAVRRLNPVGIQRPLAVLRRRSPIARVVGGEPRFAPTCTSSRVQAETAAIPLRSHPFGDGVGPVAGPIGRVLMEIAAPHPANSRWAPKATQVSPRPMATVVVAVFCQKPMAGSKEGTGSASLDSSVATVVMATAAEAVAAAADNT